MTRVLRFKEEDRECFISDELALKIEAAFDRKMGTLVTIQGKQYKRFDIIISPPIDDILNQEKWQEIAERKQKEALNNLFNKKNG